jgi:hypothetical protein
VMLFAREHDAWLRMRAVDLMYENPKDVHTHARRESACTGSRAVFLLHNPCLLPA